MFFFENEKNLHTCDSVVRCVFYAHTYICDLDVI
ncbi:MAG: hypothetical protein ACI8UP_000880, partial [Porticoccaceae bacterium]